MSARARRYHNRRLNELWSELDAAHRYSRTSGGKRQAKAVLQVERISQNTTMPQNFVIRHTRASDLIFGKGAALEQGLTAEKMKEGVLALSTRAYSRTARSLTNTAELNL
jgi:hypothetical protein